ncbi:MAG: histidine triad nucleotide-binding protein [Bacillota bacterium]|nr:histidine triad nucleotide-binding protein [Bacillota bacterium]
MEDCIFCKIINKEIPSEAVYEDDYVLCIKDINPMAPVHLLVLTKKHICCANVIDETNSLYAAKAFEAVAKIAKQAGIDKNGYRVVNNCGDDGGQTVKHLHFHILGGKKLPIEMA